MIPTCQETISSKVLGSSFILCHHYTELSVAKEIPWLLLLSSDITRLQYWRADGRSQGRFFTFLENSHHLCGNPFAGDFLLRELWYHMRRRHAIAEEPARNIVVGEGPHAALALQLLIQRHLLATTIILKSPDLGENDTLNQLSLRLLREPPRPVNIEIELDESITPEKLLAAEEFAFRATKQGWKTTLQRG